MDSGTDTWVIVIAALGGGLGGSILQPGLAYILERLRAGEHERKKAERRLRRMVESWLGYGTSVTVAAQTVLAMRQEAQSITDDGRMRLMLSHQEPGYLVPRKIKHDDLREKVQRYYDIIGELGRMIWDPKFDEQGLVDLMKAQGDLQGQIIESMDDLKWPELED